MFKHCIFAHCMEQNQPETVLSLVNEKKETLVKKNIDSNTRIGSNLSWCLLVLSH